MRERTREQETQGGPFPQDPVGSQPQEDAGHGGKRHTQRQALEVEAWEVPGDTLALLEFLEEGLPGVAESEIQGKGQQEVVHEPGEQDAGGHQQAVAPGPVQQEAEDEGGSRSQLQGKEVAPKSRVEVPAERVEHGQRVRPGNQGCEHGQPKGEAGQ